MKAALQRLQEMDLTAKTKRYPNVPTHVITRTAFSDRTANGLTKCVLSWMSLNSHYATRISSAGRRLPDTVIVDTLGRNRITPGKWIPGTTRTGTADIHAVIDGKHVSIEVKVGKDRMSDRQHKTKEAIEQCGGAYWIVRNFEDFLSQYERFKIN